MFQDDSRDLGANVTINNPIEVIDEAFEKMGYFSHFAAFSLACAFFEYFSYKNLRKKGGNIDTFLNKGRYGPNLEELIKRLKKECIINTETFEKMNEVRLIRNKIVHPRGDISKLYKPTEAERIQIETAKDCIRILQEYKPCMKKD